MKKFLIHIYKNIRFLNKKRETFNKLKTRHKRSGVWVTYYDWFTIKKSFVLQDSKLPEVLNQFSLIEWQTLKRKPKRKIVAKVIGGSLFDKMNEKKKRVKNLIQRLKK